MLDTLQSKLYPSKHILGTIGSLREMIICKFWTGTCVPHARLKVYLFNLVVHLEGWLDLPSPGHVPRGVDPVPHLRLGLAVHHLHSLVSNNVVL